MPRHPNAFPVYRHHKATNQAVCTVHLSNGQTKDIYLGRYNSAAARAEFGRIVAVVAANGGTYPAATPDLTINEGLVRYVRFVDGFYRDETGKTSRSVESIKTAMGYLKRLFGTTPLAEFGPPEFKVIRSAIVGQGIVRKQVNKRLGQIRQFFKWAVEEQFVSPSILEGLRAVRPLTPGRSGVKEGELRQPANPADVEKVIPFLSPAMRAAVLLLRFTGARPSEILSMKAGEIDRAAEIWKFTPPSHKTAWKGKSRVIFFGPESQAVLGPWMIDLTPEDYVLSPNRSEALRNEQRGNDRKTPRWESHMLRNASKRTKKRKLPPGERFNRNALALAVKRACQRAQVKAFSPYCLRHLKAVELRERYGLEVVRAVLGQSSMAVAEHYSKGADAALAARAAMEAG